MGHVFIIDFSHMPMMTKYIVTHKPFIKSLTMYAYSDSHNIYLTHVNNKLMYDKSDEIQLIKK